MANTAMTQTNMNLIVVLHGTSWAGDGEALLEQEHSCWQLLASHLQVAAGGDW